MERHLHRLGGWAFSRRRRVLGAWAAVILIVAGCAIAFGERTNDRFEVPGTESQAAQRLLEAKYPAASGSQARMVFAAPARGTLNSDSAQAAIRASLNRVARGAEVDAVTDPTISRDGRVAFADVVYASPAADISDGAKDALVSSAGPARAAGLHVEWSGGIVITESQSAAEGIGLLIAFVVLAVTLASLLSAGMPLLTAGLGVLIGSVSITALTGVTTISSTAPVLAIMLGLAVGIDYTLFILTRYRQHAAEGMSLHEAAATATGTAGAAVVFAGATVMIALAGLAVLGIPFLTVMGLAAAGTVAIAVLIALTLTPALLGFAGERALRPNRRLARTAPAGGCPMSRRYVEWVTGRPKAILIAGTVLLAILAIPAAGMKLGLPDDGTRPSNTTERRAYDLLSAGFGPGFNGPLTIVVDAPEVPAARRASIATAVSDTLNGFPGVAGVGVPSQNTAGDLTVVQITPAGRPASDATTDLVHALRRKAGAVQRATGVRAYVTGTTALNIDTSAAIASKLPAYAALVAGSRSSC